MTEHNNEESNINSNNENLNRDYYSQEAKEKLDELTAWSLDLQSKF